MALTRTKKNSESFHQQYSELSDEIRAKNKREDRLLEIRLKYYERERNIRLNILRKEQHHLERARSALFEQIYRIQQDRHKQGTLPSPAKRTELATNLVQLSTPEFFESDWESTPDSVQAASSLATAQPKIHPNAIRPHSAG